MTALVLIIGAFGGLDLADEARKVAFTEEPLNDPQQISMSNVFATPLSGSLTNCLQCR